MWRKTEIRVKANMQGSLTVGDCPQPLFLELQHLVGEAHAFLADDVLAGHADVIEEHFGSVR